MAMGFGPLSNDGGERRLNVLITRARECCCVYSSIKAEDIDLNRAKSKGAKALKAFLKYAETGLLDTGTTTGKDYESEFERQVALAVRQHGYEIEPQVGVAGFFIDLAIIDPDKPGRYLLGIECDGASYHRSRSARDRDRLRQAVLEDRGWIIHRIWSTDWFQRPDEEIRKTLAAIDDAKIQWAGRANGLRRDTTEAPAEPLEIGRDDREADAMGTEPCCPVEPYVVASFRVHAADEIHELSPFQLAQVVAKIIEVEGPIHREEIARRVAQLFGRQRAGRRICDAVDSALTVVGQTVRVRQEDGFFAPGDQVDVPVRDRAAVDIVTLRKPDMIPPAEIRKALTAIVAVHLGVETSEAVAEASRLFGFKSTKAQLRRVIEQQVDVLIAKKALENRNGKLYTCQQATAKPNVS